MILQNYTKEWDLSAGLSKGATLAATCLSVLLIASCSGIKQFADSKSHSRDSVMEKNVVTTKVLTVPLTQAALRLNLNDVQGLTPGSIFTDRNGQASVRVERQDSIVIVTATCDSLQLLAESQTREIFHLRTQLEQQNTQIEKTPDWWSTVKNNAFYIAIGMFIMLAIIYIKRIWQIPTSRWRQ